MFIWIVFKNSDPTSQETPCLLYEDKSVNAVQGNNRRLFLD
jgi:hypothetical protein